MNLKDIESKAAAIRAAYGGTIFSFPVNKNDPFSEYAVAVYTGSEYKVYGESMPIEEASAGIFGILEGYKKIGIDPDYDTHVRLVSYEAQVNAPSVTMRRLKKTKGTFQVLNPVFENGVDVHIGDGEEEFYFSARGLIKYSYIEMVNEKNPKAIKFMDEYYGLLASKKYGKTAAAIRQEVRRMGRNEALKWIENTYSKYIHDDQEVKNILNSLGVNVNVEKTRGH